MVVRHAGGDHGHVLRHGRWGRGHQETALDHGHVFIQVDDAVVAKALARLARIGVDGDHGAVHGRRQDAARAFHAGRFGRRIVLGAARVDVPIRHATADHVLVAGRVAVDLRIVAPDFLARIRIQGDDDIVRRAQIQHVVDLQRRDFVGDLARVGHALEVARVVGPGFFQAGNVGRGNLRGRGIAVAIAGAAIRGPVIVLDAGRQVARGRGGHVVRWHLAMQVMVILEQGDDARDDGQGHGGGERRLAGLSLFLGGGWRQAAADERQQQPDGGGKPDVQARQQLPPVEFHFNHGPDEGGDQQQRHEGLRAALAFEDEHACDQHAYAGQQVVPGASERGQPDAAAQQGEAEQNENNAGDL